MEVYYKFKPLYIYTLWGGNRIKELKNISSEQSAIGESWEISAIPHQETIVAEGIHKGSTLKELIEKGKEAFLGKRNFQRFGYHFPLLVKIIDATKDLSIQVHPNDIEASKLNLPYGKNEMWVMMQTEPKSHIHLGFKEDITEETIYTAIQKNNFCKHLQTFTPKEGDAFFIPSGCIHSIGKGNLIVEIQQSCNITYRIFDYNRVDDQGKQRELHLSQALKCLNKQKSESLYLPYQDAKNVRKTLFLTPFFQTFQWDINEDISLNYDGIDSFKIFVCTKGGCTFTFPTGEQTFLNFGETLCIPACVPTFSILPHSSSSSLVETYII